MCVCVWYVKIHSRLIRQRFLFLRIYVCRYDATMCRLNMCLRHRVWRQLILRWILCQRNPNPDIFRCFPQLPLRLWPIQPRPIWSSGWLARSRPRLDLVSLPNFPKIQKILLLLPSIIIQLNRSPHFWQSCRQWPLENHKIHPTVNCHRRLILLRP